MAVTVEVTSAYGWDGSLGELMAGDWSVCLLAKFEKVDLIDFLDL
jgi:hypothetical protein